MHELSIVSSVVDSVTEAISAYPGARVQAVNLRIGTLQSVIVESLEFCWGIATQDTPLAGSRLAVKMLPVVACCTACGATSELPSLHSFTCPQCHAPVTDLRQGRELDIDSVEIEESQEALSS